ncbi:MAG: phosphotransferase [Anaerolineae bacterium]
MCAPPVAHLDDLKLLLQGAVGGRPFAAAMARGEARLGGAVARALWRFNRLDIDVGRSHGSGDELGALGRRVETWMAGDLPEAEARLAQKCLAAVAGGHASMAKWRYVPIHRDFYPDQLLVAGHRVCFLDLDDVAMSEPAVDVANFTAHMRLAALVRPEAAPATRRVAADFVAACAALDPGLDLALVRFLEGATLLRLAAIHGPRRGGRRLVIPLLRTAATALVPPLVPPLGLPDVALA